MIKSIKSIKNKTEEMHLILEDLWTCHFSMLTQNAITSYYNISLSLLKNLGFPEFISYAIYHHSSV